THQRQRAGVAIDRLAVRCAHLQRVLHEHELREVVVHRGANEVLAGGEAMALGQGSSAEVLVQLGARRPRSAPVFPALDRARDLLEVGEDDAVRDEAGRPVRDGRGDAGVLHPADCPKKKPATRAAGLCEAKLLANQSSSSSWSWSWPRPSSMRLIFQIVPVPGICTSGASAPSAKRDPSSELPGSRTAP